MKPRGIRNKNPGNIRWGDPWQGLVPPAQRTDKSFCQFVSCPYGIRALVRVLITYQDKHKLSTIDGIISRWAPPVENDTEAYIMAVVSSTGFARNKELDMQDYAHVRPVAEAIIRHENGKGPLRTLNTWYEGDVVDKGLKLAGVEPTHREVAKVPVTKETIGASTVGTVGTVSIIDSLPRLIEATGNAGSNLDWQTAAVLVGGGLLVLAALLIAWAQVTKYRKGIS